MTRFNLFAALAAGFVTLPAANGHLIQESAPQPPQQVVPAPQAQADPAKTPEAVEKAMAISAEVAKAYREVINLKDEILVRTTAPGGIGQDQELTISLGKGTNARLGLGRLRILCIDSTVYIVNDLIVDKYLEMPMDTDLVTTIRAARGQGFPIPHFALRRAAGKDQIEDALTTITGHGRITGYREVTDEKSGKTLDEILGSGPNGDVRIRVSQDTHFLQSMHLYYLPPNEPEPFMADITFSPRVYDELPDPIVFDPGDRQAVLNPGEFERETLTYGDEFPKLEVTDINGGKHALGSFDKGVQVVIFFSIELVDLEVLLDTMQRYADWVKDESLPIDMVAVSMIEKHPGERLKKELASLWSSGQYTYPVVMDLEDEIAKKYPVLSFPCVMLVSKAGTIEEQYMMTLSETTELKSATRKMLGLDEPADEEATEGADEGSADEGNADEGGG